MRILSASLLLATSIAASPAWAQTPSVTVYADCEFTGKSATFSAGNYKMTDMLMKGIANDAISSIKVDKGTQVKIYKHDKYSGSTLTFNSDRRCLKGTGLNDDISSLRVRALPKPPAQPPRSDHSDRQRVINFDGGRYERTGTRVWTQYDSYGRTAGTYEQLSRRRGRLFLYDARTEDLIEIDRERGTVRIGPFGEDNPVRHRLDGTRSSGVGSARPSFASVEGNYTDFAVKGHNVQVVKFRDKATRVEGLLRHQGRLGGAWDYEDSSGRRIDVCEEINIRSSQVTIQCERISGQLIMDVFWNTITLDRNGETEDVAVILKAYRLK